MVAEPVTVDLFADTKIKPLARGKQRDSFTLSAAGRAAGHFWEGAVRSGKTIASIIRWLLFIATGPPGPLAMIGKTERTLKRNVLDVIVALIGPKRCRVNLGTGVATILGRTVYLCGANDEGAVAKLQGMTLVGWYGDEIPTWPQAVFDMARTRLSEPGAEWFGTGNPASLTHHLKVEWIDRAKLHLRRDGTVIRRPINDPATQDVHVYSFTIYDNPMLDPGFVQRLERSYSGMFYRRNILGEWCMAEGAIYESWDPERHALPFAEIPQLERWIGVGIDHGTVNPFVAGALGIGPAPRGQEGRALYLVNEWRWDSVVKRKRLSDRAYALHVQRWLRDVEHPGMPGHRGIDPDMIAVDPSASGFRESLYELNLLSVKADNEVLPGIRDMASLVEHDRFYVCQEGAPELIAEFPGYSWDDRAAKLGQDKPIKIKDHSLDEARYIVHTSRHDWWAEIFPEMADAL